jgi:alanyl-tRNA synthetase
MKYDEAQKAGAMALFGEKYGDEVRVLDIGFSTRAVRRHARARTGDIGFFKIVSEAASRPASAASRRSPARARSPGCRRRRRRCCRSAAVLKAPSGGAAAKIAQVLENVRASRRSSPG